MQNSRFCGSLGIASLFSFCAFFDDLHKMCCLSMLNVLTVNILFFFFVFTYVYENDKCFYKTLPVYIDMIFPCLQSLQGKEGKENR